MPHTIYFKPDGSGKFLFEQPTTVIETIKGLRKKRHKMVITEVRPTRTLGANAYYWKIVISYFMNEMGIPDSETGKRYMHYDVLGKELRQIPDPHREGRTMTEQTHTMDGSKFWKYIYKCEVLFTHMFNGSFPPPRSLGYDTTKR